MTFIIKLFGNPLMPAVLLITLMTSNPYYHIKIPTELENNTEIEAKVPKNTIKHTKKVTKKKRHKKKKEKITKKIKKIKWEKYVCTAYCPCCSCSEGYGRSTATGHRATAGRTIAVDPKIIPYGTKVKIKGMGVYRAEDCGGAIKGNRIDIFFDTHSQCVKFGKRTLKVLIIK